MTKKKSTGLKQDLVAIVQYQPTWAIWYEEERQALQNALGSSILAIEHIGSTAIPQMPSKPIIDINIAIPSLDHTSLYTLQLQRIGYKIIENQWFKDRYFFTKELKGSRVFYVNLVEIDSENAWLSKLWFRDYITSHPKAHSAYAKLKTDLSEMYASDRKAYTEAKTEFVQDIIQKARTLYA